MRNYHQRPVGMAPLSEVNYSLKGKEKTDGAKPSKNIGKFKKSTKISTKRTNLKTKVWEKERNPLSATAVVVLIILQRSVKFPNTWSTYIRNPSKRLEKQKDRMKLILMLHPMRIRLQANALMKLQSQVRRPMTILMERT
jgi:hypothetical protein